MRDQDGSSCKRGAIAKLESMVSIKDNSSVLERYNYEWTLNLKHFSKSINIRY